MIKLSNLSVKLGKTSVTYLDTEIKRGKVTFIKGKNGTGKTTLMRAIAGLIPFDGEISLDGSVTYNSQEPVLFRRSVLKNITYPLEIRGLEVSEYMKQIKEYISLLDLDNLIDKDATTLSSGEKMKVSIIRAIIFNPDYVLLDEPTTHLDFDSVQELITLVKKRKEETTFIIVSHNKEFIDALEEDDLILGGSHVYR